MSKMESYEMIQEDIGSKMFQIKFKFKRLPKEKLTVSYIESKIEVLNEMWALFSKTHIKIINSLTRSEYFRSNYFKTGMWHNVEELYVQFVSELKDLINEENATSESKSCSDIKTYSRATFPEIKLLIFSGKYTEWFTFKRLFLRLIHKNESLNDAEKLHYLKAHLTGEAKQFLRNVEVNSDNYQSVWENLNKVYDDKISTARGILKRLINESELTPDPCAAFKRLINSLFICLDSIENLGVNVISWDILLIEIINSKLDPDTKKAWELNMSRNSNDEMPLENFSEFLINRVKDLDFKTRYGNTLKKYFDLKAKPISWCAYCSLNHKISKCEEFFNASNETRSTFVQEMKLCYMCLRGDHFVKNCKSTKSCRYCRGRHHTELHTCIWYVPEQITDDDESDASSSEAEDDTASGIHNSLARRERESLKTLIKWNLQSNRNRKTLVPLAVLPATSKNGTNEIVRTLLDQGLQASFVTERKVQSLGLMKIPSEHTVRGIDGVECVTSKFTVRLSLKYKIDPEQQIMFVAHVIDKMDGYKKMADPEIETAVDIDMLIGAEVCSRIITNGIYDPPGNYVLKQNTIFGWITSGVHQTLKYSRSTTPPPRNASNDDDGDEDGNDDEDLSLEQILPKMISELMEITE